MTSKSSSDFAGVISKKLNFEVIEVCRIGGNNIIPDTKKRKIFIFGFNALNIGFQLKLFNSSG